MDKTFLRITEKQFKLMLAIDSARAVLGWQMSSTRSTTDIQLVLEQILAKFSRIDVLITDGSGIIRQ